MVFWRDSRRGRIRAGKAEGKIFFGGCWRETPLGREGESAVSSLTHADGQAVKGVHDADGEG
ncbi:hypothetical protein D3C87_2172100 [compost metagenome]